MSEIDDIDERFTALTAQITDRERRRMSRSAARSRTRPPRSRRSRRRWTTVAVVAALVAATGLFVMYRPDVVDRFRAGVFGGFAGPGRPDGGTGRTDVTLGTDAAGTDDPSRARPPPRTPTG
ncbi:hypothetical protein ACIBCT_27885 [Streptosporangium sp. NPDC050855]|uniref:hypothetical protein n=1 Tax=Streptosporangium sp. NPDC050855 TaxID=3366194 RepID=UPI00378A1EC1